MFNSFLLCDVMYLYRLLIYSTFHYMNHGPFSISNKESKIHAMAGITYRPNYSNPLLLVRYYFIA